MALVEVLVWSLRANYFVVADAAAVAAAGS